MEVTIIGSGTCVPTIRRGSPGIFLHIGESKLLLDTGPGTLRTLSKLNIAINEVDLLIYSHFHPDHTAELVPFIFASKYSFSPRKRDLRIIGPKGLKEFYRKLKDVYGKWITPELFSIEWIELQEDRIEFEAFSILSLPLSHTEEAIGIRIEREGKSIVYSGDTDYCTNIVKLSKDCSLLILECSLPDHMKVEGHLTPSLCGKIAKESNAEKLLLTHLYPPCDEEDIIFFVKRYYNGPIIIAEDMMRIGV